MNLKDTMMVGSRRFSLALVLGLMEEAESPLEAYRWAATAMMYAFDKQDLELREQVNEILTKKGLKPYAPDEVDDEKSKPRASASDRKQKVSMTLQVQKAQLKMCIEQLMSLQDEKGKELFYLKNHWWAIYRICIDLEVLGMKENRYKEFIELIGELKLKHVNAELDMTTLSNISQEIYSYPFYKWENKKPHGEGSRKQRAYLRLYDIAEKFQAILEEKGF